MRIGAYHIIAMHTHRYEIYIYPMNLIDPTRLDQCNKTALNSVTLRTNTVPSSYYPLINMNLEEVFLFLHIVCFPHYYCHLVGLTLDLRSELHLMGNKPRSELDFCSGYLKEKAGNNIKYGFVFTLWNIYERDKLCWIWPVYV